MPTIYKEVEVEVDIEDFDTDELITELESRGALPAQGRHDAEELIETIWMKRRLGKLDYQTELDQLIYAVTGRIV